MYQKRVRPVRQKPPFDVFKSIWAPRAKWADSKDVYDTEDVEMRRFQGDWRRALDLGIGRHIMRIDDDGKREKKTGTEKAEPTRKEMEATNRANTKRKARRKSFVTGSWRILSVVPSLY